MSEPKDAWSKFEVAAKILTPLLLFVFGTYYTFQQQNKDAAEKRFDRYISLGKSLSSDKPLEQKIAMVMLKIEKDKHPDEVPDELLSITIPPLLSIAATDPNADVADQAKQLAIDLSKNTNYAGPVQGSVEKTTARIFFHIQYESQRKQAQEDVSQLKAKLGSSDFLIPEIRLVTVGPKTTELRYFRETEAIEANHIRDVLTGIGLDAKIRFVSGYENSTGVRPRLYEVWFGPNQK